LSALIDVDIDVNVVVYNGPATVRSKCLVGNFGWRGLVEQLGWGTALGSLKTVLFVISLPLHDGRTSTCAVFVNVDITTASRETVVLFEAEVFVVITTTTCTTTAARDASPTATSASSSHLLEPGAIPSLRPTTRRGRRLVKAV
jgi:hypothetical protein